jgi:hypothetical protein
MSVTRASTEQVMAYLVAHVLHADIRCEDNDVAPRELAPVPEVVQC